MLECIGPYLSDILTASAALLLLFVELGSALGSGLSWFFPGLLPLPPTPMVLLNELKFFLICNDCDRSLLAEKIIVIFVMCDNQCDQISRFLKVFDDKCSYNSSPNI